MNAAFLEDTLPEYYQKRSVMHHVSLWLPQNLSGWVMMLIAAFMISQLVFKGATLAYSQDAQTSAVEVIGYEAEMTRTAICHVR